MVQTRIVEPVRRGNALWFWTGLAALVLNRIRRAFRPYDRPRDFSPSDVGRAVEYDLSVFGNWMQYLGEYLGAPTGVEGKAVLELGPGADLGAGLIALARGAERYVGVDAHDLARSAPMSFYDELLGRLAGEGRPGVDALRPEVIKALEQRGERLRYVCRSDFDLAAADVGRADLIVSQAAFEHFDDPDRTIAQLGEVAAAGAVLLALVDLQTHSRFLRDRDPLNIYRYPDWLYRLLRFSGSPNRFRREQYVASLERAGWTNIRVMPLLSLGGEYVPHARPHLARRFRDPAGRIQDLCVVICATKG
ncbi:MAG TPA: class I SAM-dependent methyltransferase [Phycisphaerae bacterium]|nr:class I SAM-dependent methyltransferase [Phycisphaerae bacterium]